MSANCNKISQKLLFMIPVHSMEESILPPGAKKDGKIVCRFGHYFVIDLVIILS